MVLVHLSNRLKASLLVGSAGWGSFARCLMKASIIGHPGFSIVISNTCIFYVANDRRCLGIVGSDQSDTVRSDISGTLSISPSNIIPKHFERRAARIVVVVWRLQLYPIRRDRMTSLCKPA